MLKVAFPVDIHTDRATYEIQFGTVERPTHKNTSWDAAKFEVCGHKYADISEGNYGVSILNDCKYGHDIHDGVISLSLLRSPTYPNENADRGKHSFTYAIYPHSGDLKDCDTAKLAYYLNYPMTAIKAEGEISTIPESFSAISVASDHVICETVKEEENGTGTIVRLYEHKNMRDTVELSVGLSANKAYLCDMMENELCELPINNGKICLDIKGFEILTVKLK
jgi:alpha-mannosidase